MKGQQYMNDKRLSSTMCDKILIKNQSGNQDIKSIDNIQFENGKTVGDIMAFYILKNEEMFISIEKLKKEINDLKKDIKELRKDFSEYIDVEESI